MSAGLRVTFWIANSLIWRLAAVSFRFPTPVLFGPQMQMHAESKGPFFVSPIFLPRFK